MTYNYKKKYLFYIHDKLKGAFDPHIWPGKKALMILTHSIIEIAV